jgi:hypothetical protein
MKRHEKNYPGHALLELGWIESYPDKMPRAELEN